MPTVANPAEFKSAMGPMPRQQYRVQILKVTQEPNMKNKCPQDLFDLEIVSPDAVEFEGSLVQSAGRLTRLYITYSSKNLANARDMLNAIGVESAEWTIPTEEEVTSGELTTIAEVQGQTKYLTGKQFDVTLQTSPSYKRLPPKPGQTKYNADLELGPDGKPQVTGHNIDFFRAEDVVSKAF